MNYPNGMSEPEWVDELPTITPEAAAAIAGLVRALEAIDALMVQWDATFNAGEASRRITAAWRLARPAIMSARDAGLVKP